MMKQKKKGKSPSGKFTLKSVSNNCFRRSKTLPLLCNFGAVADEAVDAEQESFTFGEANLGYTFEPLIQMFRTNIQDSMYRLSSEHPVKAFKWFPQQNAQNAWNTFQSYL